ncbi:hypothetical protein [Pontibacter actiniarum]|uniref:YD repeat-containing protein n=1 Tax=Pontibacter actiniarum TaxID=323450 RepID=A0A1X9YPC8_9BACT|nr:hypothetical protein [Pontibacter actiniarum]ARS34756.1 hypothetical protein CA264_04480 [Pontibacter actiniarum]
MKTRLLLPFLGLALLSACGEEELPTAKPTPEPQNLCYLQEQVVRSDDGVAVTKYTYNELNQIIKTERYEADELVTTRTYEYNTAGKLVKEHHLQPSGEEMDFTSFSYRPDGRLSKYEVQRVLGLGVVHHLAAFKASYDQQGRLTSGTDYYYLDNKQQQNGGFSQSYPLKKPVNVIVKGRDGKALYNATFQQDSSRSPLSATPAFLHKRPAIGHPNLNNFSSFTATVPNDTVQVKAQSYTTKYVNNSQGYPTEATISFGDKKVVRVEYSYSCD